jgi:hypothetical protein
MSTHRIAAAVLSPVILLCLTACGGDSSSEATPGASDEATPEATDEATPEATDDATPEATDDATAEATDDATRAPEPKTFTISGTYAEQGEGPRSEECVSGKDQIIVKTAAGVVALGNTSAEGKYDKQAKACLYKFIVPDVAVTATTYGMQVGTSEAIGIVPSDAEGLFITATAP